MNFRVAQQNISNFTIWSVSFNLQVNIWTTRATYKPVVSITMWSNLSLFFLTNSNSILTRSPRTVQHRQPLLTMIMSSPFTEEWLATSDPSISTSPNCIIHNKIISWKTVNPYYNKTIKFFPHFTISLQNKLDTSFSMTAIRLPCWDVRIWFRRVVCSTENSIIN